MTMYQTWENHPRFIKAIDFNLMKSDQYMYSGTEALTFPSTWGCYTTPTITQCAGRVQAKRQVRRSCLQRVYQNMK